MPAFRPKLRARPRMGVREYPWYRSTGHLTFVRKHHCAIEGRNGHVCTDTVEAAHVRCGTDGGASEKPSDWWTLPLCGGPAGAHAEQHRIGEPAFERRYGINLRHIAALFWRLDAERRHEFEALKLPIRADLIGAPPSAYVL